MFPQFKKEILEMPWLVPQVLGLKLESFELF